MNKVLIGCMAFFMAVQAKSQSFFGLQNSNFNGVHAMYINPAGLADSRHRQHANILTFGHHMTNNYVGIDLPFSIVDLISGNVPDTYKTPSGSVKWDPSWLKENLDGKPKNFNYELELRGPAFMTRIGKKLAVGVGTRTRSAFQINNLSEEMATFIKSQADSQPRKFETITDSRFAVNVNAFQEFNGSLAMVLLNKQAFYLKGGATIKYLMGIGSAYAVNNGINFETRGNDTVIVNNSDLQVGYSNTDFLNRIQNGAFAASMPSFRNINGTGFGFDFGAIFEYRPDFADGVTSQNRYFLRGGLSLMDFGSIKYSKNINTFSIKNTSPVVFTADSAFSSAFSNGIDSGIAFIKQYARDSFNYTEGTGSFTSNIPTTLNIQLDWNVFKMFYLGMNWTQSVVSKKDISLRRPSSFVLLPRFETRLLEVSMPISVHNDYKDFGLGLYARLGPVFVGTDHLFRTAKRSSFRGFDFYFGISTGIGAKKAKKKD